MDVSASKCRRVSTASCHPPSRTTTPWRRRQHLSGAMLTPCISFARRSTTFRPFWPSSGMPPATCPSFVFRRSTAYTVPGVSMTYACS
eukprot:Skav218532  [mRNA]  locus=scaffold2478:359737:361313:- [translate_table: standard]